MNFPGATGNTVEFDENGDAPGRYTIYQYQRHKGSPGSFHYLPIGNWSNGYLLYFIDTKFIQRSIHNKRALIATQ